MEEKAFKKGKMTHFKLKHEIRRKINIVCPVFAFEVFDMRNCRRIPSKKLFKQECGFNFVQK